MALDATPRCPEWRPTWAAAGRSTSCRTAECWGCSDAVAVLHWYLYSTQPPRELIGTAAEQDAHLRKWLGD
jgi:hypothetical protein